MPRLAPRPCRSPGCPTPAYGKESLCTAHDKQDRRQRDSERGSAHARGYGRKWRRIRDRYLAKHPLCVRCYQDDGRDEAALQVDHIVPRSRGGTDDDSNLQGLCNTHHSQKTAREDGRWGA